MDKKTLIFDFDGTLANSFEHVVNILYKNMQKSKYKNLLTKKEIKDYIQNKDLKQLIKEYKLSKIQIAYIIYKVRRDLKKEMINIKPFPEVENTLKKLHKKYSLYLLTSNNKKNVIQFLKQNNIKIFDKMYFKSSLFGKNKNLLKIIKKNNLKKENVTYIGDETRDIIACQKINIKIVATTYGYNSKKLIQSKNPNFTISKFKEILDLKLF